MTSSTHDLSRAVKPVDSWWTVLAVDPLAVRVLPALVRVRRLTPQVVTCLAFGVGLVAVALFALGHYRTAGLVYEVRFFLDCLDGKIARVRRLTSRAGAVFDRLADGVCIPAAYAAFGLSLAHNGSINRDLALAPALLSCLVVVAELMLELARQSPDAAAPVSLSQGSSAVGAWLRRHRLTARPWTVEAETVGLFLAPVLLSGHLLGGALTGVAAAYVAFFVVDVSLVVAESRREGGS